MKRDQKLVALFLEKYNELTNSTFQVDKWADQIERNKPAVEAIALDQLGISLAIEHTLLQPFKDERNDTQRFLAAIDSLEKDSSLKLPKHMVNLSLHVGTIPKGVDWSSVNRTVREWLRDNIAAFPLGTSSQIVPNLPFELRIGVDKIDMPHDEEGKIFFGRYVPPDTLAEVMRTALSTKLPKLVGTNADKRILLLEKNDILHGYFKTHEVISSVGQHFAELSKIDEIWLANTVAWESENYLNFCRVWPDVVMEKDFLEMRAASGVEAARKESSP